MDNNMKKYKCKFCNNHFYLDNHDFNNHFFDDDYMNIHNNHKTFKEDIKKQINFIDNYVNYLKNKK